MAIVSRSRRDGFQDSLETLEPAGAKMPILDPVHQEQQTALVAKLALPKQVLGIGGGDTAFALDSFNQNGRGSR